MKKCPICEKGELKTKEIEEKMFNIYIGKYQAEVCTYCGESFVDEDTMNQIEKRAKDLGIWNLSKKTRVSKSGNSLVVTIPKNIAKFMDIEKGKDILIHPDGKSKLVIEVV